MCSGGVVVGWCVVVVCSAVPHLFKVFPGQLEKVLSKAFRYVNHYFLQLFWRNKYSAW